MLRRVHTPVVLRIPLQHFSLIRLADNSRYNPCKLRRIGIPLQYCRTVLKLVEANPALLSANFVVAGHTVLTDNKLVAPVHTTHVIGYRIGARDPLDRAAIELDTQTNSLELRITYVMFGSQLR